jgi:hypothetical protein
MVAQLMRIRIAISGDVAMIHEDATEVSLLPHISAACRTYKKLSMCKQSLATTHSHLGGRLSTYGGLQHYILILSEHVPYSCPPVGTQIAHFLKEALGLIPEVEGFVVWRHEGGEQHAIAPAYMDLPMAWDLLVKLISQFSQRRVLSVSDRQRGR